MKVILKNSKLVFQGTKNFVLVLDSSNLVSGKYLSSTGKGFNESPSNCVQEIVSLNGANKLDFYIRKGDPSSWRFASAIAFYSSNNMNDVVKVVRYEELFNEDSQQWIEFKNFAVPDGATHAVFSIMGVIKENATPFYVKGFVG